MTPGAIFCGQSMLKDIHTVLLHEKPDVVITLQPNDIHHDHWPVYAATMFALKELSAGGEQYAKKCDVYTYLIHRNKWPEYYGLDSYLEMLSPDNLANLYNWKSLPLTHAETILKGTAIAAYKSQGGDTKPFYKSFARKNELYAIMPVQSWPSSQAVKDTKIIIDPAVAAHTGYFYSNGDILAVWMGRENNTMKVRVDTRGQITPDTDFHVEVHAGGKYSSDRIISYYAWVGKKPEGKMMVDGKISPIQSKKLSSRISKNSAYINAPWPMPDKTTEFFMIRAWTGSNKTPIDATRTAVFQLVR